MTYRKDSFIYTPAPTIGPFGDDEDYGTLPSASNFLIAGSTFNASINDINGGLLLETGYTGSGPGSLNRTLFLLDAPTPPYTAKICFVPIYPGYANATSATEAGFGVCFRFPGLQIHEFISVKNNDVATNTFGYSYMRYNQLSAFDAYNYFGDTNNAGPFWPSASSGWYFSNINQSTMGNPYFWMTLSDLGVGDLLFGMGLNAKNISQVGVGSRTPYGSPANKIGILMQTAVSSAPLMKLIVQSFKIT